MVLDWLKKHCLWVAATAFLSFLLCVNLQAEVITDGSVGRATSITGPDFTIPQSLGSTVGTNLFHSFQSFNIANTQSATFTGANTISNVISRVTGGQSSTINGVLRSEIGQANFYFINPAGIVFGPNASINVPAAFHASTAANLQFSDGAVFNAVSPGASTLSMANPSAFGFVANRSADIRIEQSQLRFSPDTVTSLSGGDIVIESGTLVNEGGRIRITAVGKTDSLVSTDITVDEHSQGDIQLSDSLVNVNGNGAGRIAVNGGDTKITMSSLFAGNTGTEHPDETAGISLRANTLQLENSLIRSDAVNTGDAGNIEILVGDALRVENSTIASDVVNSGDAGKINLAVGGTLTIAKDGLIKTESSSEGNIGTISVRADNFTINAQSSPFFTGISATHSAVSTIKDNAGNIDILIAKTFRMLNGGRVSSLLSRGKSGLISVQATNLDIDGRGSASGTGINSITFSDSGENAGTINVVVTEKLSLVNGGSINSTTFGNVMQQGSTLSESSAGSIVIQAGDVAIDGRGEQLATGLFSSSVAGNGDAGDISVSVADSLSIINSGRINSSTLSESNGGSITVQAGDITIDGQGGASDTGVKSIAERGSNGQAGNIDISAMRTIKLANGGQIISETLSEKNTGSITVKATDLAINRQESRSVTGIRTIANTGSGGNAESIDVSVKESLNIVNGGAILSGSLSKGDTGSIMVSAGNLTIDQQASTAFTGISTTPSSESTGGTGNIDLLVRDTLNIVNGGLINTSRLFESENSAGSITVLANNLDIDGKNKRVTGIFNVDNSASSRAGGGIDVSVKDKLTIVSGGKITIDNFSDNQSGSISVLARDLVLDGQGSEFFTGISSRSSSSGDSGNITVSTQTLSLVDGGQIDSSTFSSGNAGSVSVHSNTMTINDQNSTEFTGIRSQARTDSSGNAGNIEVSAKAALNIINGGQISSDTFANGHAGSVTVSATDLTINRQGSRAFTGITSAAEKTGSNGQGGNVEVLVTETLNLINGGKIDSSTSTNRNAGSITVQANVINIDRQNASFTGIRNQAKSTSNGNAGDINVSALENLNIVNGGQISSATSSTGDAGSITVQAGNVSINSLGSENFTGIVSNTESDLESDGDAGSIKVSVSDFLSLVNGGQISSNTFTQGDAGSIEIETTGLIIDRQDASFTGIATQAGSKSTGDAGNIEITAGETVNIINGGLISSDTFSEGDAGSIIVDATDLTIDGQDGTAFTGITSSAETGSGTGGKGGSVKVFVTDTINLVKGGKIDSSTSTDREAGSIIVKANDINIDRQGASFTGIRNQAKSNSGDAGDIDITARETLNIVNGGLISIDTFSEGKAGSISVKATNLTINGQESDFFTGITSAAEKGSSGDGGSVDVLVAETLNLVNGGQIDSSTFSVRNAGSITVQANNININGQGSGNFTGISSSSEADISSNGNAGRINVSAVETLRLVNGGLINSSTFTQGKAGSITVQASDLIIDSLGNAGNFTGISSQALESTGKGGFIDVSVKGMLNIVNGGQIDSSTFSGGNAGSITVHASDLTIDSQGSEFFTGIGSGSEPESSGNAGSVNVSVTDTLNLVNGGQIDSSTSSQGSAGTITVQASEFNIDGLSKDTETGLTSRAFDDSSGQAGSIQVNTNHLALRNNGRISIQSEPFIDTDSLSVIQPTTIDIQTNTVTLDNNSTITAQSAGNVPASNIVINATRQMKTNASQITTAANQADGGAISIGGGNVFLENSQITTSVAGKGNGGNITLSPRVLVLNTGFVQANTAGSNASGGDININSEVLISSNNHLQTGGNQQVRFEPNSGLNVIQAAAPDGVSGNILRGVDG